MADDAKLLAVIDANTKQFENALKRIEASTDKSFRQSQVSVSRLSRQLDQASLTAGRLATSFGRIGGAALALAGIGGVVQVLRKFIDNTVEQEKVLAQLNATLASTGGVVGLTSGELSDLAAALQASTTFSDEAILSAEALLLTFTKISGDILPRATATVLDMSAALGQDLKSSAIQLGKALNDPIQGLNALRRVGVSFSEAQRTIIKDLVKSGEIAKAQAIILKELQIEFGGSADAARNTLGGALQALGNAWGDLFEVQGPASEQLRLAIENLVSVLTDQRFKDAVNLIGVQLVRALENAARAAPQLADAFINLRQEAENFRASFRNIVEGIEEFSAAAGRFVGADAVGEILGVTDENLLRIDRGHQAVERAAEDFELLAVLQRKAVQAGGDLVAAPAEGQGLGLINADIVDDETAALEAEAAAIEKADEATKAASRSRAQAVKDAERQKEAVAALILELERELSLVGATDEQRRISNELHAAGAAATEQDKERITELVSSIEAQNLAQQELIDQMDTIRGTAHNALGGFIDDLRNGKSAAEALRGVMDSILDSLIQMALQKTITSLFGAPGTAAGGILAGVFHEGGVVGQGGPQRRVSPLAYAGAPHYQRGGVAGFKPGEIPAVLHRGEIVLPAIPRGGQRAVAGRQAVDVSTHLTIGPSPLFEVVAMQRSQAAIAANNKRMGGVLSEQRARFG